MDQIALAKLKAAEPEEFYLVTVALAKGVVTKMETGLNEERVKEHFTFKTYLLRDVEESLSERIKC